MKSYILAAASAASAAALVAAHEARSPLGLDLYVGNLVNVDLCLGLEIKLPLGISLGTDGCPKFGPPADCINVWHPPHDVDIDGCDSTGDRAWHYVHPCKGGCGHHGPRHRWTTSTITQTNTIIDNVQTVVPIPATTTICPVPVAPANTFQPIATQAPAPQAPAAPYQAPQPPPTYAPVAQQPPVVQGPGPQFVLPQHGPIAQGPGPQFVPNQQPPVAPYPTNAPVPVGFPGPVGTVAPYNPGTIAPYNPGYNPGYNHPGNTSPVVIGGASDTGQRLSMVAAAIGLAAALIL